MVERLVPPNPTTPFLDVQGRMTQQFRTWTQVVSLAVPITGTGSPEAVIEALQGQLFMDTDGIAGAILYIKRDADISGDKSQGWIAV